MIDIMQRDNVQTRRTGDGRSVTFISTDLLAARPLQFWACVADTGAEGSGALIRLDTMSADDGWTVRQLLGVALARLVAEQARSVTEASGAVVVCLDKAIAVYRDDRPDSSFAKCGDIALSMGGRPVRPLRHPALSRPGKPRRGRHTRAAADRAGHGAVRLAADPAIPPQRLGGAARGAAGTGDRVSRVAEEGGATATG